MLVTYTCGGQMSSWTLLNFSQRASTCLLPHLIPLGIIKTPLKEPKCPIFHLLRAIAWPPGGQLQKLMTPAVRLCPKINPAKFRPNPSIFGTTCSSKTDEWRRAPCSSGVALQPRRGAPPPQGGSLRDLSSSSSPEPPSKREPPRFARWLINPKIFFLQ